MAAYKVINLDSPIESDYWVDIPVRDPATNKDAVDEQGRILVERHVTRSVKNEEMSTINAAVETVNTLKEDYSTFKEEVSTKVNTHDSSILTNTNNITTLTDSVTNHDLQINALYTKINAIQGIDIDDFKYVTETDIKNIKKNYLPLAGGTLTGSLRVQGNETSVNLLTNNPSVGSIYLYASKTSKGLGAIGTNNVFTSLATITPDNVTTFYGSLNGNATSSTKTTNDSAGRNIVNTYALKDNYPDRIKFAWDTTFKNNVNVTVDRTTWALVTSQNISSQSVKHAISADSATNATNASHATIADRATNATNATNANHATNATKATQDSAGQQINTTYVKGVTTSNATITVTKGNGTTSTATINNVANATKATNADKLDGLHASASVGANTVVARDVNGYVNFNYINSNTNNNENPPISQIIVTNGSDNYYRKASLAHLKNSMGITTGVVPTGAVIFVAMDDVPSGYLLCHGGAVSRTTYSALFAKIGTKYGRGNGSTTFNLPNLMHRFIQGNATAGDYKSAGLPNITGSGALGTTARFDASRCTGAIYRDGIIKGYHEWGADTKGDTTYFDASRSNSIYGNSTTVQPPALTLLPCIKY